MTVLLPLWSNEGCLWCRLIRDRPLRASVGFHMELGSLAAPAREHSHPKACCHTNDLKSFDEQKEIENNRKTYKFPGFLWITQNQFENHLKSIWKAGGSLNLLQDKRLQGSCCEPCSCHKAYRRCLGQKQAFRRCVGGWRLHNETMKRQSVVLSKIDFWVWWPVRQNEWTRNYENFVLNTGPGIFTPSSHLRASSHAWHCMTLHDPIFTPAASPASATTSGMRSTKLATTRDCVSPIHFHYVWLCVDCVLVWLFGCLHANWIIDGESFLYSL